MNVLKLIVLLIVLLIVEGVFFWFFRTLPNSSVDSVVLIGLLGFFPACVGAFSGSFSKPLLRYTANASFILLGLSLCTLPMINRGAVSLFVGSWLLGRVFGEMLAAKKAPGSWIASMRLSWNQSTFSFLSLAFLLLLVSFSLSCLVRGVMPGGVGHLQKPTYIVCGYIAAAFLAFSLLRIENKKEAMSFVFIGLGIGVVLAVFVCLGQYWNLHPLFSSNINPFFRSLGRCSASFSDPNAFGVMGALLIPAMFFIGEGRTRRLFQVAALSLLAVLPLSGSRTAWLGLAFWIIGFVIYKLKYGAGKRALKVMACFGVLGVLAIIALGQPELNARLRKQTNVTGFVRMLQTIDWNEAPSMFDSRRIYSKIALEVWKQSPWIGVGLDGFYRKQARAARSLGIDLNGWRDNANNFYLQILSEQGILGMCLVLSSFILFGYAVRDAPFVRKLSLGVLAVMLITGPHFFFDEVRYMSVLLLVLALVELQDLCPPSLKLRRAP